LIPSIRKLPAYFATKARRQATGLELIPSETWSPRPSRSYGLDLHEQVRRGLSRQRYYGGCEYATRLNSSPSIAQRNSLELNTPMCKPIPAHSANVAVYMSTLQKDDVVLGMNLSHGGHLTHGHPLNFSGRMYKFVAYGVKKEDER